MKRKQADTILLEPEDAKKLKIIHDQGWESLGSDVFRTIQEYVRWNEIETYWNGHEFRLHKYRWGVILKNAILLATVDIHMEIDQRIHNINFRRQSTLILCYPRLFIGLDTEEAFSKPFPYLTSVGLSLMKKYPIDDWDSATGEGPRRIVSFKVKPEHRLFATKGRRDWRLYTPAMIRFANGSNVVQSKLPFKTREQYKKDHKKRLKVVLSQLKYKFNDVTLHPCWL